MVDRSQIEALRRSADELKELSRSLTEAGTGLADAEGSGSDETGIVTATVRGGGTLTSLAIADDWRRTLGTDLLGPAVFSALGAARSDLEAQWEAAMQDAVAAPATTPVSYERRVPRRSAPSPDVLSARIDAIVNATDEQDSYLAAVRTGELDSSYPSPAGYFTVHTASGRVTALDADDYKLTFASGPEIADDVRAVFDDLDSRADAKAGEIADRFPAIAELQRRLAEGE